MLLFVIVGWLIAFLLSCHICVIKGWKNGGYAGYADPLLASGFTSAEAMQIRATVGAGISGGISECDKLFVMIGTRQGGDVR